MRLCQVILFVHDAERMQRFYEAVVGLRVVDGAAADGFVRLADPDGGGVLALHATAAVGAPAVPPAPRVDTAIKPCFHVDDVAAARALVIAHGAQARDVHRFGAVAFCDVVDPEGNIFQLTSRDG
jgi:catechol 2,3-dioxygenase-like lactoylglutathione lyase family enzyme